jgi:hypothetical protein
MANYPTSDPSFGTKSDGNTIAAAHVNALQDEVVAIGAALRGGLSHGLTVSTGGLTVSTGSVNVAGPSSLTTLQVNGASTFAGAVSFSAGVTFSGAVSFGRIPSVRLTNSAKTELASGAFLGLSWDTETYDSTGLHSTAANSSRLFLTSSGLWAFQAQCEFNSMSSGQVIVRVMLNDASAVAAQQFGAFTSNPYTVNVSGVHLATDTTAYLTVQVYQGGASTGSVNAGSTTYGTWFAAQRISQ